MPKDIQKGIKDLFIQPSKKTIKAKKPRPAYLNESWFYGFHLKQRYVRRMSEKYSFTYQADPNVALFTILYHLASELDMHNSFRSIRYRGKMAWFIAFMEDDGRKRLHLNKFTEERMDSVRSLLLLPEGTKPKWYDYNDNYDKDGELSSEDESLPPSKSLKPASPACDGDLDEDSDTSHKGSIMGTNEGNDYEYDEEFEDTGIFFESEDEYETDEGDDDSVTGVKAAA